jgi:hypothetical protein
MKKFIIPILGLLFSLQHLVAQNEFDALRYSNLEFYGDARFNAMGGSFGALGANMSSLSLNPAGIGVYKSSDMSFTPAFHYNYTDTKLDGNSLTDGKLNFHFSNIGIVGNFSGSGDWQSVSVGMGYNRTSNFNTSISAKGKTDKTMLNKYVNELNAGGGTFDGDIESLYPFSSNLAYQNYLVNPTLADSLKYDNVFQNSKNITQTTNYETRGGSGEVFFTFGGNYNDKLYLGATMGVPTVRYIYDRNYSETSDVNDTLTDFKSFSINDYVKTTGAGVNLKLGMIYKVTDWVRIGAAFHTPTIYGLTDSYQTTMKSEMKNGTTHDVSSPFGNYSYLLTTPYRFISSVAFVVGDYGVINADYELVDYAMARLKHDNSQGFDGYDFSIENQSIRNNFQMTQNVRVGTEWRLDPFRVRAGYRFQGDPIKNSFVASQNASTYSLGFGIKQDDYYFDMAYALRMYNSQTIIVAENDDFATTELRDHYITFTLGFRF